MTALIPRLAPAFVLWMLAGPLNADEPLRPGRDRFGDPLPAGALARLGTVRMRHSNLISGVAFSRDGKSILASDWYSGVHVWSVAEGKEIRRFLADPSRCEHLALSADGRTLAVALWDTVRFYAPDSGRELASLPKETVNGYGNVAFSPDGSLLATAIIYKKLVRIWDIEVAGNTCFAWRAIRVAGAELSSPVRASA